jgi:hypothetical protein
VSCRGSTGLAAGLLQPLIELCDASLRQRQEHFSALADRDSALGHRQHRVALAEGIVPMPHLSQEAKPLWPGLLLAKGLVGLVRGGTDRSGWRTTALCD